ncbi:replicative DNA helicase [Pediococcus claussenii]|uniref:replicative DNA helicase n=1 Tax=Pediococcus claussenii TaxID=187452 RepID=UPI00081A4F77|nr:DnaB-like helicase C-terminal domain-containing protein [Pediococcus claussenii]ANZ70353.1 DNA helicase [Pediococcus claussenii]ANZ72169.1 DNA helicase [Pediococcus claussenii]
MNNEIEREIISILLNNPNKVEAVSLNEEWFLYDDYRSIFQALKSVESYDMLTIYGKYHTLAESPMEFSKLKAIADEGGFISQLDTDISNLHELYLNQEINRAIQDWRSNPFEENEAKLKELLEIKSGTQTSNDDGSLKDTGAALLDSLDHPKPHGIETYSRIDDVLGGGMYGSMLFTIGARPSTGKTAFSVNLAYEAMQHTPDIRIDFFTLEMNKGEMLNRFISRRTGISSSALRSKADQLQPVLKEYVRSAFSYFNQSNLRIYDQSEVLSSVVKTIRRNGAKSKVGHYMAIIDYIGLIRVPSAKEQRVAVEETTRSLKRLTNELNIPIVALSQLSRGIETRTNKSPQLSDLRDSGSVEQDSNVVAFLHRPNEELDDKGTKHVQLSVRKNREGELADIDFNFVGSEMLFQELKS